MTVDELLDDLGYDRAPLEERIAAAKAEIRLGHLMAELVHYDRAGQGKRGYQAILAEAREVLGI